VQGVINSVWDWSNNG